MSQIQIMAQVIAPELIATGLMCTSVNAKQAVGSDSIVEGEEWLVPYFNGGVFTRYERVLQQANAAAPTTDAVRTVRVRNPVTGSVMYILGTMANWVDRANACCGATPNMPDVTIIDPLLEESPCPVIPSTIGTGVYQYQDVGPVLTTGQRYLISGSANGVAFTPAASGAGYANMAAVLAFATASWGAYGTWSLSTDGDTIILASTTTKTGYVKIDVLP